MKMKSGLLCAFMLTVLTGFCPCQTGKKVSGDSRARAEALSRSCSAEFDDPVSPKYKECTQAIQLLEQLRAKQAQDVSILLALGRAYANRSEEKSVDAYQAALAVDPTNVTANFALGLMLHAPSQQIQHLRAVIAQEPNHPEAHGRLAEVLAATSQTDEAVAQVKQQIAVDPNRIDVIANVMQTLAAKGNRSAAGQVCVSYLKSNLPAKVKCEDSRSMVRQYADQPDVAAAFTEQCQGSALD